MNLREGLSVAGVVCCWSGFSNQGSLNKGYSRETRRLRLQSLGNCTDHGTVLRSGFGFGSL